MNYEHNNKILTDIFVKNHLIKHREKREDDINRKLEPWEKRCYTCRKVFSEFEL